MGYNNSLLTRWVPLRGWNSKAENTKNELATDLFFLSSVLHQHYLRLQGKDMWAQKKNPERMNYIITAWR